MLLVNMHVVDVYMNTFMLVCICINICLYISYIYKCRSSFMFVYIYRHIYLYTYTHDTYKYIYIYIYIIDMFVCIHIKEVQTWSTLPQWLVLPWERELARFRKIMYCSFYSVHTKFCLSQ